MSFQFQMLFVSLTVWLGEDSDNDNANFSLEGRTAFDSSLIQGRPVWAWDVVRSKIYQSGHFIGRYPPLSKSKKLVVELNMLRFGDTNV